MAGASFTGSGEWEQPETQWLLPGDRVAGSASPVSVLITPACALCSKSWESAVEPCGQSSISEASGASHKFDFRNPPVGP